ncbi:ABC transporter permease [Rhodobacter capsulatus]|uniref:ABC transporter permease n=1 Tax=Rhodobacter capsulatus TaxID=1061 RepID=UPI004038BD97
MPSPGPGGFEAYQYEGITGLPKSFTWIGTGALGWVPVPLILTLVIAAAATFAMHRTRFGRFLKLIGVSAEVARFTGVPVTRTLVTVYALNGLACAVAGLVLTAYFTSARSDLGAEALLNIITAVVLGGSSIYGGQGSVLGTFLAGLVLGYLRQGLLALGVSSDVVPVIVGGLLIGSVALRIGTGALAARRANRAAYEAERAAVGGEWLTPARASVGRRPGLDPETGITKRRNYHDFRTFRDRARDCHAHHGPRIGLGQRR